MMIIDGELFPTKKALQDRCSLILNSYRLHEPLTEKDRKFLTSMIESYHPEAELKLGSGVCDMWVERMRPYRTTGFMLRRRDGSTTDFSFRKCISHPSPVHDVKAALRNAVSADVIAFKNRRMGEIDHCEYSGEAFEDDIHVDHKPPMTFERIVSDFMRMTGMNWVDIRIDPTFDNKVGCWLSDPLFKAQWVEFHRNQADLRLVKREMNLGSIRKTK